MHGADTMIHSAKYYLPKYDIKMRKLLFFAAEQRTAPTSCRQLDITCLQKKKIYLVTPKRVCSKSFRLFLPTSIIFVTIGFLFTVINIFVSPLPKKPHLDHGVRIRKVKNSLRVRNTVGSLKEKRHKSKQKDQM